MRTSLNFLKTKISISGEHTAGGDLLRAAYERTGVKNRPKDASFFFYYMIVKDQDLDFMVASLLPNESAGESQDICNDDIVEHESNYARKQRKISDNAVKSQIANDARQIAIIKAVMTPTNSPKDDDGSYTQSQIAKNMASAENKNKNSLFLVTL